MSSPWFDLLCLHGYITEVRWLRPRMNPPPNAPPPKPVRRSTGAALARRAVTSLRLCLGIGDGALRSQ